MVLLQKLEGDAIFKFTGADQTPEENFGKQTQEKADQMKARFFRVTPEPMQVIGVAMKVPVRL